MEQAVHCHGQFLPMSWCAFLGDFQQELHPLAWPTSLGTERVLEQALQVLAGWKSVWWLLVMFLVGPGLSTLRPLLTWTSVALVLAQRP